MRGLNIAGGLLLVFGFFLLWLTYSIGISGNTDQRPYSYMIIGVAIMLLVLSALIKKKE